MTHSGDETAEMLDAMEPASALALGGVLGATTFLLCALLLGARSAIAIAGFAAVIAVVRRAPAAAMVFAAATALAAAGLLPSNRALIGSAATFGVALAILARSRMRAQIADAMSAMHDAAAGERTTSV